MCVGSVCMRRALAEVRVLLSNWWLNRLHGETKTYWRLNMPFVTYPQRTGQNIASCYNFYVFLLSSKSGLLWTLRAGRGSRWSSFCKQGVRISWHIFFVWFIMCPWGYFCPIRTGRRGLGLEFVTERSRISAAFLFVHNSCTGFNLQPSAPNAIITTRYKKPQSLELWK